MQRIQRSKSWSSGQIPSPRQAFGRRSAPDSASDAGEEDEAATKLQANWRARQTRLGLLSGTAQKAGQMVLDAGKAVLSQPTNIAAAAKRKAMGSLQGILEKRLTDLYEGKLKLSITPDRHMP